MSAFDRLVERMRRLPPIAADAALALAILPFGIFDLARSKPQDVLPPYHLNHWSFVLFAMMCLPLAIRRRHMLLSYALIQGAALLAILAHVEPDLLGVAGLMLTTVLIFALADRAPAWVAVLASFAQVGVLLLAFEISNPNPNPNLFSDYIAGVVLYFPPWAFGFVAGWSLRRRRTLTARLEARADDVRVERERIAAQAVAGERIRMAHELRALVFRGVEWMTGQARTARRHLEVGSAAASAEIAAIEATGRGTLIEMRRLLLLLRGGEAQHPEVEGHDPLLADNGGRTPREDHAERLRPLPALPPWLRKPWVVDVALVVLLAGSLAAGWSVFGGDLFPRGIEGILTAVILVALLVRSRIPFAVLCVIAVAVFVWILAKGDSPDWSEEALLVAVYTVAVYKEPRWAVAAVALAVLSWIPLPFDHLCLCLLDIGTLAILGAAGGAAMRAGRRLNRDLEKLTDQLLRTREERVRLAVAGERTRVAREMHDVVAHGVTVMVVQAGGARMVAQTDPVQAAEALHEVERMGVEATHELESLLPALDPGSGRVEQGPSADALDVRGLVEHFRRTGQEIQLTETGAPSGMDQGLQTSLHRIVQEALTNVRKHAQASRAAVSIRYLPQAVEVEVINGKPPAAGGPAEVPGAGQGLIGIRERAALFGGIVEMGPTPEGGFRVAAHLPLELVPT